MNVLHCLPYARITLNVHIFYLYTYSNVIMDLTSFGHWAFTELIGLPANSFCATASAVVLSFKAANGYRCHKNDWITGKLYAAGLHQPLFTECPDRACLIELGLPPQQLLKQGGSGHRSDRKD